jgi:hypothetical protein
MASSSMLFVSNIYLSLGCGGLRLWQEGRLVGHAGLRDG